MYDETTRKLYAIVSDGKVIWWQISGKRGPILAASYEVAKRLKERHVADWGSKTTIAEVGTVQGESIQALSRKALELGADSAFIFSDELPGGRGPGYIRVDLAAYFGESQIENDL